MLQSVAGASLAGFALSGSASAESSREVTIEQGGQVLDTVVPFSGGVPVEEFYNYNGQYGGGAGSSANTPQGLEEDGVSSLFLYEHEGTTSLVVIHDAPNSSSGGSVRFEFEGLPADGSWSVRDDPSHAPDSFQRAYAEWRWGNCCTDGGAYSWSDAGDLEFSVAPRGYYGSETNPFDGIHTWRLLSGDGRSYELDPEQPITVSVGQSASDPRSFGALTDQKLELASHIDSISHGYAADRARVEPSLEGLADAIEAESLDESTAVDAVERMLWGEQVTDAALAGAGGGTSQYLDGEYDIARQTSKLSINPVVVLASLVLGISAVVTKLPVLGSRVSGMVERVNHAIADLLEYLLGNGAAARLVRERGEAAAEQFLAQLVSNIVGEGALGTDQVESALDESETVSAFVEDTAEDLFGDVLFEGKFRREDQNIPTVPESLDRLDWHLGPDGGGPTFEGPQADADAARKHMLDSVEQELELGQRKLDNAYVETFKAIGAALSVLAAVASILATIATGGIALPGALAALSGISLVLNVGLEVVERGAGLGRLKQMALSNAIATELVIDSTQW